MKLEPVILAGILTLAAFPAAAAEKAKAAPKCFAPEQISSHKVGDGHTLFLKAGGATWRVDMINNCLGGIGSADPLTIGKSASATGGICSGDDLEVRAELGGGGLPTRCRIDKMTRLTPAEVAALRRDVQP